MTPHGSLQARLGRPGAVRGSRLLVGPATAAAPKGEAGTPASVGAGGINHAHLLRRPPSPGRVCLTHLPSTFKRSQQPQELRSVPLTHGGGSPNPRQVDKLPRTLQPRLVHKSGDPQGARPGARAVPFPVPCHVADPCSPAALQHVVGPWASGFLPCLEQSFVPQTKGGKTLLIPVAAPSGLVMRPGPWTRAGHFLILQATCREGLREESPRSVRPGPPPPAVAPLKRAHRVCVREGVCDKPPSGRAPISLPGLGGHTPLPGVLAALLFCGLPVASAGRQLPPWTWPTCGRAGGVFAAWCLGIQPWAGAQMSSLSVSLSLSSPPLPNGFRRCGFKADPGRACALILRLSKWPWQF